MYVAAGLCFLFGWFKIWFSHDVTGIYLGKTE